MYDDGSEVEIETPYDDPPSSGTWVDAEDILHNPTEEELREGNRMGQSIDLDDDEDNGL